MLKHELGIKRVKKRVSGRISDSGRASVRIIKTNKFIYALLFDENKRVLTSFSTASFKKKGSTASFKNKDCVEKLALKVVDKCKEIKMSGMAFDRGGYLYHGVVKSFAEKLRENSIII